jgi:hypothetical protein
MLPVVSAATWPVVRAPAGRWSGASWPVFSAAMMLVFRPTMSAVSMAAIALVDRAPNWRGAQAPSWFDDSATTWSVVRPRPGRGAQRGHLGGAQGADLVGGQRPLAGCSGRRRRGFQRADVGGFNRGNRAAAGPPPAGCQRADLLARQTTWSVVRALAWLVVSAAMARSSARRCRPFQSRRYRWC